MKNLKYTTRQIVRSNGQDQIDTQRLDLSEAYDSAVELMDAGGGVGIDIFDLGAGLFGHSEDEIIVGRLVDRNGEPLDQYLVQVATGAGE